MKKIKTYENKNILILGLGKSGFSVAKLLLKLGAKLTLNDKKDLSNDDRAAELDKLGVEIGVNIKLQHENIFNKMHRI